MMDVMPTRFISKDELHKWYLYESNLCSTPYVKKYLGKLLQEWVTNLANPLASSLVLGLFENDLSDIDNDLSEWGKVITEDNLIKLIEEVPESNKAGNADKIAEKLKSLNGEMLVYKELKKEFKEIKKIDSIGDWLCDDNLIVSVKTKYSLDFNYQVIEDAIKGLLCIEENSILRNYNYININDANGVDYEFRNKVIWFLNTYLIGLLNYYSKIITDWEEFNIKATKYCYDHGARKGYLELNVTLYEDTYDSAKKIEFLLKEDRAGESKEKHGIKITFNSAANNGSIFNVNHGPNVFDVKQELTQKELKDIIELSLKGINSNYTKAQQEKQDKKFMGWINISVHLMHNDYVKNNIKEVERNVKDIIGNKDYKIRITFSGVFELKQPITLEL